MKSLNKIHSLYQADSGENGRGSNMKGKSGKHMIIKVPNQTIFKTKEGEEIITLELDKISKFIAARGGVGGKGNAYFLSNDNKKPMQFEHGHKGEEVTMFVELKLMADCAFVGFFIYLAFFM